MKRQRIPAVCLVLILISMLFAGCGRNQEVEDPGATYLYYVNLNGTGLEREEIDIQGEEPEEAIDRILADISAIPDSNSYTTAFPEDVSVTDWKLNGKVLTLTFNEAYNEMDATAEILLRAAVVQSLTQIEGVDSVVFMIGKEPLTDSTGEVVGTMNADSFVSNTGVTIHANVEEEIPVYFATKKGNKLVRESMLVTYNTYSAIEKVIMETLLAGPKEGSSSLAVLPAETKILSVSLQDEICYVNLDEKFLDPVPNVTPEVVIYSIVDSIVEAGNVNQVQILVNGESDIVYQDVVDLSKPLEKNTKIIKK